jgi:hypothetical protein
MTCPRRVISVLLAGPLAALALAGAAHAGTFNVTACGDDHNPGPYSIPHLPMAGVSGSANDLGGCPDGGDPSWTDGGLSVFTTGAWANGGSAYEIDFTAPANSAFVALNGEYNWENGYVGSTGWTAGIMDQNSAWQFGGPASPGGTGRVWYPFSQAYNYPTMLRLVVVCTASVCSGGLTSPPYDLYAHISMRRLTLTLANNTAPSVANPRGPLWTSGWVGGQSSATFDAVDDVGIQSVRAYIDGRLAQKSDQACDPHALTCPNWGGATLPVPTYNGVADGRHTLTLEAVDRAGNVARASRSVLIDNTPPGVPEQLAVDGGDGWRTSPKFTVRWTNPTENPATQAPIAGAAWKLCPAGQDTGCTTGSRSGANLTSLDLEVPKGSAASASRASSRARALAVVGDWQAKVWLIDAAGNQYQQTAGTVHLRYDNDSPDLAFAAFNADDPARIHVTASDPTSQIAAGQLSLQRRDRHDRWGKWRTYPAQLEPGGFNVMLDDEHLKDGYYRLVARAIDAAGNQRETASYPDGSQANITLPVRLKTRLRAGKARHVRRGRHHHRVTVYRARPAVAVGHRLRLHGRLTGPGGLPIDGAQILVTSQVDLPESTAHPIATLYTDRTGRFTYLLAKGPARAIAFHYVGAPKIRSATRIVAERVRASSTIRRSRRALLDGQAVTFRGKLRGGWIPYQGKLIEVQFYARGKWRTFATTRTDRTGRWAYRYRFTGTHGTIRYRFRARIPRETGYPYVTGRSHRVRVTVRGR